MVVKIFDSCWEYPVIYMDWDIKKRSFSEFLDSIEGILIDVFKGFGEV